MLERSPEATRKLASRARRRVRDADVLPDSPVAAQREVVDVRDGRIATIDVLADATRLARLNLSAVG